MGVEGTGRRDERTTTSRGGLPRRRTRRGGFVRERCRPGQLDHGVAYYAGSRVVTYRTDLFKKAGITKPPSSLAEYTADAQKLLARTGGKGFSPVYIAGEDWYVAMAFVYDYGGAIAKTYKGKWVGTLNQKPAIEGLTAFKNFFLAASRASKTTIETQPNPYDV